MGEDQRTCPTAQILLWGEGKELTAVLVVWPAARKYINILWTWIFYLLKGGKYYVIVFIYKNQKGVWTADISSETVFHKNQHILEMGLYKHSIFN